MGQTKVSAENKLGNLKHTVGVSRSVNYAVQTMARDMQDMLTQPKCPLCDGPYADGSHWVGDIFIAHCNSCGCDVSISQ